MPELFHCRSRWTMFLLLTLFLLASMKPPLAVEGSSCTSSSLTQTVWTTSATCQSPTRLVITPDGRRFGLCQGGFAPPVLAFITPSTPVPVNHTCNLAGNYPLDIVWSTNQSALIIACGNYLNPLAPAIEIVPMANINSYNVSGPIVNTPVVLNCQSGLIDHLPSDAASPLGYALLQCGSQLNALPLISTHVIIPLGNCLSGFLTVQYIPELNLIFMQCAYDLWRISFPNSTISQPLTTRLMFSDYYSGLRKVVYDPMRQVMIGWNYNGFNVIDIGNINSTWVSFAPQTCQEVDGLSLDPTSDGVLVGCPGQANSLLSIDLTSGAVTTIITSDVCAPRDFYLSQDGGGHLDLACTSTVMESFSGENWWVLGAPTPCFPQLVEYDPASDTTITICLDGYAFLRNGKTIQRPGCVGTNYVAVDSTSQMAYVVCPKVGIQAIDLVTRELTTISPATDLQCDYVTDVFILEGATNGQSSMILIGCAQYAHRPASFIQVVLNSTTSVAAPPTVINSTCIQPDSIFLHHSTGLIFATCGDRIVSRAWSSGVERSYMINQWCPLYTGQKQKLIPDVNNSTRLFLSCTDQDYSRQFLLSISGDFLLGQVQIVELGEISTLDFSPTTGQLKQDPVTGDLYLNDQNNLQLFIIHPNGTLIQGDVITNSVCNSALDVAFDSTTGAKRFACDTGVVVQTAHFRCLNGYYWSNGACNLCPIGTARSVGWSPNSTSISGSSSLWSCTSCLSGTIAALPGSSACNDCQPGKYSTGLSSGNTVCYSCLPGEEQPLASQSSCNQCKPGYYSSTAASPNCLPCPAGSASSANGTLVCPKCRPGSYANVTGLTDCYLADPGYQVKLTGATTQTPCPGGEFSNMPGTVICSGCLVGKYQPLQYGTTCYDCQPGKYQDLIISRPGRCYDCPAGQYAPKNASIVCSLCAPGKYQPATGQADCIPAESGYMVPEPGASDHTLCIAGTASDSMSGSVSCRPCPRGTYTDQDGQWECQECPVGKFASGIGNQQCELCPAGSFASSNQSSDCTTCARGTYSSVNGTSICQDCTPGTFASDIGSTGCALCDPGSYTSNNQSDFCISCSAGSASNISGLAHSCDPCPPGYAQPISGQLECLPCRPPYYAPNKGSPSCTFCPYKVNIDHTGCDANPCPKNYEYIDNDGTGCQLCPLGEYSNNATIGGCVNCIVGFYTPERGADCVSCTQSQMDGLICVGGLASVKVDYFAYLTDPDPVTGIQLYATEPCPIGYCPGGPLQLSAISGQINANGSSSSANLTSSIIYCEFPRLNSPDNLLCGQCVDGYLPWNSKCVPCTEVNSGLFIAGFILSLCLVIFLLRSGGSAAGPLAILLYFIQTAALEIGSVSQWLNWLHIVNLGTESTSACLAPWSPQQQMIFSICIPILLLSEVLFLALCHSILARCYAVTPLDDPNESNSWIKNFAVGFSFDRYIGGCMSVLLFTYTQVTTTCLKYLYCVDVGPHHRLVFTSPTLECHSDSYRQNLILVGITIAIYVVGFPICVFILLWRHRHHHFARSSIALSQPPSEYSIDVKQATSTSTTLTPFATRFGPLYLMFHSSAWFYQPFILLRRASFVLISVLLVQDPSARFLAFGLGNFASLLIHSALQPFTQLGNNQLETVSYILLTIVSMVLTSSLPPYDLSIQLFVFFGIIPFGGLMVIFVIRHQLRQIHEKIQQRIESNSTNHTTNGASTNNLDRPFSHSVHEFQSNPVLAASQPQIELPTYPPSEFGNSSAAASAGVDLILHSGVDSETTEL